MLRVTNQNPFEEGSLSSSPFDVATQRDAFQYSCRGRCIILQKIGCLSTIARALRNFRQVTDEEKNMTDEF